MSLSREELDRLVKPIVGLEITEPWQGYGSAMGIEFGRLQTTFGKVRRLKGEASILLEWCWRFESDREILFGAFDAKPLIAERLAGIKGLRVVDVRLEGRLPELVFELSNGIWLRSFSPVGGDPQWTIFLPGGSCLHVNKGGIERPLPDESRPAEPVSKDEKIRWERAEATAERWGTKEMPEARGHCGDCVFYVRLNGSGHYLDYGACTSPRSFFDGRVVSFRSGCASFRASGPEG